MKNSKSSHVHIERPTDASFERLIDMATILITLEEF